MATPSTVAAASLQGITRLQAGRRSSRLPNQAPHPTDSIATGSQTDKGSSEAAADTAPRIPSRINTSAWTREGLHSRRQGADALDQGLDFAIVGSLVAHEPVPEPIVLGFQEP